MENTFTADVSVVINADASKVWDALTNPALVKQYLFGTNVKSDWKVGSPITYTGVWEGKEYEDKGIIKAIEPGKYLSTTYWSSFSGTPDAPENYQDVSYTLEAEGNGTKLTVHQGNIQSAEKRDHSAQNWRMVLDAMKKLLEQ